MLVCANSEDTYNNGFTVNIQGKSFLSQDKITSLGLIKDVKYKWNDNIEESRKNCNRTLWKARSISGMMNKKYLKIFIESTVLSKLYYMIPLWGDCNAKLMKSIEKIYKSCYRLLGERIPPKFWLSPSSQYLYECGILSYRSLHGTAPEVLCNKVRSDLIQVRQTRNTTHQYINDFLCNDYLERLLTNTWIKIPQDIRECATFIMFKKMWKQFLYEYDVGNIPCCCDFSCIEDVVKLFT